MYSRYIVAVIMAVAIELLTQDIRKFDAMATEMKM